MLLIQLVCKKLYRLKTKNGTDKSETKVLYKEQQRKKEKAEVFIMIGAHTSLYICKLELKTVFLTQSNRLSPGS